MDGDRQSERAGHERDHERPAVHDQMRLMQPVSQGPCHEPKQQDRDDRHSVIGKRVHGPSERPIGIVADIDALSAEPVVHDGRGVNADIDRRNERDDVHDPIAQRILRRRNGHVDAEVARLRA